MIVITQALVLDPVETSPLSDQPWIGWHNLVTAAGIAADTAASGYPASNMATAFTHRKWIAASTAQQYVTVTLDGVTQVDYLAIARHNLGSAKIPVSVEGYIGGVWTLLAGPVIPGDDAALIFRFAPQPLPQMRVKLAPGTVPASISVVYAGKLLIMQRRIYAGHVPLPHARKTRFVDGVTEGGNFMGRVQLRSWLASMAPFRQLTPDWSRANLIPFLANGRAAPFFFAWRPASYPYEVGYAWLTNDPMPTPQQGDGNLTSVDLEFEGIA